MMRRAWRYFLSSFGDYLSETETLWRPLRWAVRDTWDWWRRPVQPTPEWAKQINEIIDTTLRNRSPQLVANITKNNALLAHLSEGQAMKRPIDQDRAADKAGLRKEITRNANADRVKDSGKVQIAALRRMAAKKGK